MPHIHEKIDFTAEVFVVFKNKVLLRKHDKSGIWLSVGGHIELDEDPNEAALREVREEVGLDVTLLHNQPLPHGDNAYKELIPPLFLNRNRISATHEHVTLTYAAVATTDKLVLSEEEKTDGCKWFTREELTDPQYGIKEHIIMYALRALDVANSS